MTNLNKNNQTFLKAYADNYRIDIDLPYAVGVSRNKRILSRLNPKYREIATLLKEFCYDELCFFIYPLYYTKTNFHWVDFYFPNKLAVIIANEFEYLNRRAGDDGYKVKNLKEYNVLEVVDWESAEEIVEQICIELDKI